MVGHAARLLLVAALGGCVQAALQSPPASKRVAKQIHTKASVVDTEKDHNAAETHFGGGEGAGHGKYFMYQHLPHHDHYEFGYRRGNEHHFKERYEKAQPHHGHFKTKARWGDKHGGYGEHYWDYNHGGHHGDEGGSNDDEGGDGSHPVPEYHPSGVDERVKRQHEPALEGEGHTHDYTSGFQPFHDKSGQGRNDKSGQGHNDRSGRGHHDRSGQGNHDKSGVQEQDIRLAFDTESGTVVDERTGKRYLLTPIN